MIHPTANIYKSTIGAETKVAAFVEIGGSNIGRRCKVQSHAFIPPGTIIEDNVFVGPHVCFTNCRFPNSGDGFRCEPARVKSGAVIGARAVIGPGITIGRNATIEMGAILQRDVPDDHLYKGTPEAFTLRLWYRSQADVELPMTFDEWRTNYDRLTYADQLEFYTSVYEKFPDQHVANAESIRRFCAQLPADSTVLEIGGGLGAVAQHALQSPNIDRWFNYEICQAAVNGGLQNARYSARVPTDFVWNLVDLPACDALVASHVFEHIRASQIDKLLGRLDDVSRAYVECPIPLDADAVDWSGRWNTHILEIGWKQLESLFAARGFFVTYRGPDIRWFQR